MIFPLLRRHFLEPLYIMKSGSAKLSYWRRLEESQFYSRNQLEEIQWSRLQKLWRFLWRENGFYQKQFQNAGLKENDLKGPEDIRRLPILTKKEILRQGHAMLSTGYQPNRLLNFKTGGSTGKALEILITEECSELRNACARRHDRWTGWEPGEQIGAVWGNPKLPKTLRAKLLNACVQPYIYLDTMAVTDESVQEFAKTWDNNKPTLLFGHAHSLYIVAKYIKRLKIDTIRPVGILSTSMMLLPHERTMIERVFNCSVTDRYGCEEVSLIACECEKHNGMHMNIEHLVIEFIREDGSHAGPGEPGRIVVTDLMNRAMPFVRYEVEDVGVFFDQDCTCGRGLPLMGKVTGRVADFLLKRDGTRVAGVSLIENTLTRIPGIEQMQIVQEDLDSFNLNIVPGKSYGHSQANELERYFQTLFGDSLRINIRVTDEIKPEKSGKYRFSICKIDH
ncbi:phenylacetate--CoA ligase family protein [Desulfosediminicola sp.]|uniref:phenylacetate--CoA ligase family protein n=1 Tax=Desulfosediminicola sp. TaxID=2886825 RepID=UPI003AF241BD